MLVTLKRVAKFYGPKLVFKNVDLELEAGTVMLVVGPNGAGKSTILRIMAGLARPSAGEASRSVPAGSVGYLAHETFIYPKLSALENLRFWAGLYGLPVGENDLLEVLDRMGLKRVAFEQAGSFSRGMAQRLSLARALMNEPELLFLDEPGTGLDETSRAVLMREIEACRERGAAVAWVSHDAMADARRANTVLAFGDGKTAEVLAADVWLERKKAAVC